GRTSIVTRARISKFCLPYSRHNYTLRLKEFLPVLAFYLFLGRIAKFEDQPLGCVMDFNLSKPPIQVSPDDLVNLSGRSARMLERIRTQMLQPFPRKVPPVFPSARLQELCGIDKPRFSYLIKKGELPQGTQSRPGGARNFSLSEVIQWVKAERRPSERPSGKDGKVIAIGNFKGGVTKTTTSMILAQGLSMRRGRRVLHIDMDPQGSATTLYGINPHAEVTAEQTILPLIEAYVSGEAYNMTGLPQSTYWQNLDLIPSSTDLFNAEFMLPARVHSSPDAQFWNVLSQGLSELKKTIRLHCH
ncbi:ParA family protein, partial [Robbsia andropogonis]|uniref:ParA family protein n=1 Tax=Robbsia andropogonis TaxID=28092 RepID=UPI0022A9391E